MLKPCLKFNFLFFIFYFLFYSGVSAGEVYYPDGTLLKGGGPEVFVLENGIKRHILNPQVFNGLYYDWQKILQVDDGIFKKYPTGEEVLNAAKLLNGTLIKGTGPKVYLIKSNRRYWIPDLDTFNNSGYRWQNIITVSDKKLEGISESTALSPKKELIKYPDTLLLGNPDEIFETNEITFNFSGKTEIGEPSSLKFEILVEGQDKNWKQVSGTSYELKLPLQSGSYIFFVRAKNKNGDYDSTPAKHLFQVKISPHFEKIKIKIEQKNIKKSEPKEEYLSLYNNSKDTVDVGGWKLHSKKENKEYNLPENYENPNLSSWENFEILPGATVYVFTGKTSINWDSFRLNKCTGYLNNIGQFYLSLPKKCPSPSDENLESLNELSFACQEFIKKLSQCEEPTSQKLFGLEPDCQNYIRQNINYSSCVLKHKDEADFFEKLWYVFLGKTSQIWDNTQDTITLRDKDGLKVTEYSY